MLFVLLAILPQALASITMICSVWRTHGLDVLMQGTKSLFSANRFGLGIFFGSCRIIQLVMFVMYDHCST